MDNNLPKSLLGRLAHMQEGTLWDVEKQKRTADDLRAEIRSQKPLVDNSPRRFGLQTKHDEDQRFNLAMIDFAFDNMIDFNASDWRFQAIERFARTHPKFKPKRKRGRPVKARSRGVLLSIAYGKGTPQEMVSLPDGHGDLQLQKFLEIVDQTRLFLFENWEYPEKKPKHEADITDKKVAEHFVWKLYPGLRKDVNSKGKVQVWQNYISKCRGKMREIIKKSD